MAFFSRLLNSLKGKPPMGDDRYLTIYVWGNRCREPIAAQVDLMNELSLTDDGDGSYYVRKVVHSAGKHRCFDQVEVELRLDAKKRVADHTVTGGRWLTAQEYEAEVARLAAEAEAQAQAAQAAAQAAAAEAASMAQAAEIVAAGAPADSDVEAGKEQPTS
jgi:multidrug efflux pump subunit AcrA (membrane-fusion protein)